MLNWPQRKLVQCEMGSYAALGKHQYRACTMANNGAQYSGRRLSLLRPGRALSTTVSGSPLQVCPHPLVDTNGRASERSSRRVIILGTLLMVDLVEASTRASGRAVAVSAPLADPARQCRSACRLLSLLIQPDLNGSRGEQSRRRRSEDLEWIDLASPGGEGAQIERGTGGRICSLLLCLLLTIFLGDKAGHFGAVLLLLLLNVAVGCFVSLAGTCNDGARVGWCSERLEGAHSRG